MKKLPALALAGLVAAGAFHGCSNAFANKGEGGSSGEAGDSGEGGQGGRVAEGGRGGGDSSMKGGSSGAAGGASGAGAGGVTGGGGSDVNTATCMPPKLKLTRLATAASPMAVAQAPGDDRLFVAERAGLIRIFRDGAFASSPFMDLRASVLNMPRSDDHERGLLNLVLHPKFKDNGRFFVFYTRRANDVLSPGSEGDVVIAEGQQETPTKAKTTLKVLTTVRVPEDYHIGGFLGVGPDGMLYAGTGDGGGNNFDASGAGQDPKQKLSKILRINVDGPDLRPSGNYEAAGAEPLAWAIGARNPFRGSFDRVTGDLYFGDVGESSWEEINFVPPGMKNLNFGWGYDHGKKSPDGHHLQSGMEGSHPFPFFTVKPWEPFGHLPIYEYPHDGAGWVAAEGSFMNQGFSCTATRGAQCAAAVIGGMVYRGSAIKELYGRYLFGDYIRNKVMSFIAKDGKATCFADLTEDLATGDTRLQGISAFGADGSGEMFVMDISAGNIYRIEKE